MIVKIFEASEKEFVNNGLGCIELYRCIETKKKSLNGWFLECEAKAEYKDILVKDNIILAKTKEKGAQPFRIGSTTIINSRIQFTANHVAFDSAGYLLDDVRPTNLTAYQFLRYINERVDTESPFTMDSTIPSNATKYYIRTSLYEALSQAEEVFKGVYDLDGFHITLLSHVGNDNGFALTYKKNIESLKVYENWEEVCTKLLPVGPDGLLLPEKYIIADVQYDLPYTRTVSFSIEKKKDDDTDKSEAELIAELRKLANAFIEEHKYPKVNYTVKSDVPQDLSIGDIITVRHPLATFKTDVQSYRYNILTCKVEEIEFGNYVRDAKKIFNDIKNQIEIVDKKSDDFLTKAKEDVYYLMNVAGKNGSVVFRKNDKGIIYEILCMDSDSIDTARTVMRLNNQGLAGTDKGINGAFNSAIMANGTIVADAIKTGTLRAIAMKGNTIEGGSININNHFRVDTNGNLYAENGNFKGNITGSNISGCSIEGGTISVKTDLTVGNRINLTSTSSDASFMIRMNNKSILRLLDNATCLDGNNIQFLATEGIHMYAKRITSDVPISVSSDRRLKKNIKDIDISSLVNDVHVKCFDYKNGHKNVAGVIAQDLLKNIHSKFAVKRNFDTDYYEVDYNAILMSCVQKVQHQDKNIADLENRLINIENKLRKEKDNETTVCGS